MAGYFFVTIDMKNPAAAKNVHEAKLRALRERQARTQAAMAATRQRAEAHVAAARALANRHRALTSQVADLLAKTKAAATPANRARYGALLKDAAAKRAAVKAAIDRVVRN